MASPPNPPCPHDLRPGITVCLRCQHAERGAKRAKQRQMIARGGAAAFSLAVVAAVGIAAITALRGRIGAPSAGSAQASADSDAPTREDSTSSESMNAPPGNPSAQTSDANATASRRVAVSGTAAPTVAPLVPVGRTTLRDTMVAERAGDTVRVNFDLLMTRTRRPDKFEAIVRSTLPQVYGATADSALRALPFGAVARAGDLITLLPERGFHIPLAGGRTIGVWPVTREGRDGPLVVAYRAIASR